MRLLAYVRERSICVVCVDCSSFAEPTKTSGYEASASGGEC